MMKFKEWLERLDYIVYPVSDGYIVMKDGQTLKSGNFDEMDNWSQEYVLHKYSPLGKALS